MLQKEFEDRIGRKVTTEEYVEANAMYMAAGELDKDEFCREWLKIGSSKLVQCLFEAAHRLDQALQEQKLMVNECQEMISDAADAMLAIGDRLSLANVREALEKKAVWLVGRKEVVQRKAANEYIFSKEDLEYIMNNLK